MYDINEVVSKLRIIYFLKWINELLSEKKYKVREHCLKIERWQGPPHINKVRQSKLCTVSLFIQFIHDNKESLLRDFSTSLYL